LDIHIIDLFYELLSFDPFCEFLKDQNRARNLALLSQLLSIFQRYYHIDIVTHRNIKLIHSKLFVDFLNFLINNGVNNYEDPNSSILPGHVQIMTIHQAKGLQFPVVIAGSLNSERYDSTAQIDRELGNYSNRPPFEPQNKTA
jgi:DNA helicase-2/ATP-dependent DNA helicase PcrA